MRGKRFGAGRGEQSTILSLALYLSVRQQWWVDKWKKRIKE